MLSVLTAYMPPRNTSAYSTKTMLSERQDMMVYKAPTSRKFLP